MTMTLAFWFWLLMLTWLLFGFWRYGGHLIGFLLFGILGWHAFGNPFAALVK
jgi:hypothetical protein